MAFLKDLLSAVADVKDTVIDRNRQSALINRLRTVIRCEEKTCDRTYAALGRYYYHNLRDKDNTDTEAYCIQIDSAQQRLDAAVEHLEKLYNEKSEKCEAEEVNLDDVIEINPDEAESVTTAEPEAEAPSDKSAVAESENVETAKDNDNDDLTFE